MTTTKRAIAKTLEIAADSAFRLMAKGRYRRASALARGVLRELPRRTPKTPDVMALRMIAASAHAIADWFAAEERARKAARTRKKHRRTMPEPAPTLLLVPERPGKTSDKP